MAVRRRCCIPAAAAEPADPGAGAGGGARLFERTNRRVELSEARLFLHEARLVLAQVDKAADVARRAQLGELGS